MCGVSRNQRSHFGPGAFCSIVLPNASGVFERCVVSMEHSGDEGGRPMKTFGKIGVRSTERKIWWHDKRVGGEDYANRRQVLRLGSDEALACRLESIMHKFRLKPLPYPNLLLDASLPAVSGTQTTSASNSSASASSSSVVLASTSASEEALSLEDALNLGR